MSKNAHRLVLPAYLVAALLIVFPLVDTVAQLRPFNPSDLQWRFGVLGLASQALMTPVLGLLLLMGIATYAQHDRIRWLLGGLAWTLSAGCLAAAALFSLDFMGVRELVDDEVRSIYVASYALAVAKYAMVTVVAALLGRASIRRRASSSKEILIVQPPADEPA